MTITTTNLTEQLPREISILKLFEIPLNVSTNFQCSSTTDLDKGSERFDKKLSFQVKGK